MPADEVVDGLQHAITQTGNSKLMTKPVMTTLAEHALGKWRAAMNMAQELLAAATHR